EDLVLLRLLPDAADEVAGRAERSCKARWRLRLQRRRAPALRVCGDGGSACRWRGGHGGPAAPAQRSPSPTPPLFPASRGCRAASYPARARALTSLTRSVAVSRPRSNATRAAPTRSVTSWRTSP